MSVCVRMCVCLSVGVRQFACVCMSVSLRQKSVCVWKPLRVSVVSVTCHARV